MELNKFIELALKNLSGLENGTIDFDIAAYPYGFDKVYVVDDNTTEGVSRIKFSVKLEQQSKKEGSDEQ